MAINEESRLKLIIDGSLANASLKEMESAAKAAKKAIWSMAADDPNRAKLVEDYQQLTQQINEQKKAVNGTTSAMMGMAGQMGGATGQVFGFFDSIKNGASTGVKAFTTLKGAIAATGIGLLILLVTTLVGWFKKTDEGAMVLEGGMRAIGAIIDIVWSKIMGFLKSLGKFFTDPKKALQDLVDFLVTNLMNRLKAFLVIWEAIKEGDLKKATDGVIQLTTGITDATDKMKKFGDEAKKMAEEIAAAAKEGMELARIFDDLDERRRAMELYSSSAEVKLAQYLKQSQNVGRSLKERLDILKEADEIETGNMSVKLRYQDDLIAAIRRENALKERSGTLMDEDLDKLNQALITRNQMEMESAQLGEKIANRRSQLIEKQKTEYEKLAAEKKKHDEKEREEAEKTAKFKETVDKIRNDALKAELADIDENANRNLAAAKLRMYEEGKTAEWLAEREKEIALSTAQIKLATVRRFGEEEIAFEVEVAAAKDNLTKQQQDKLTQDLQREHDAWYTYYQFQLQMAAENAVTEDERLAIKIEQIRAAAAEELNSVNNTALDRKRIEEEANAQIENARKASEERKIALMEAAGSRAIGYARQVTASLTTIENSKLQRQQAQADKEKKILQDQLNAEKITKEQYEAQIAAIDERMNREKARVAYRQAVRERIASLADVGFSTASGIMKAVAASPLTGGLPWSAVIGAMGALQTGAILSVPLPEYFSGGFLPRSANDRTPIPMIGHANEYMINASSMRDPFVMNTVGLVEAAKAKGTTPSQLIEQNSSSGVPVSGGGGSSDDMKRLILLLEQGIKHKFEIDDEAAFKLNKKLAEQEEFDKTNLV